MFLAPVTKSGTGVLQIGDHVIHDIANRMGSQPISNAKSIASRIKAVPTDLREAERLRAVRVRLQDIRLKRFDGSLTKMAEKMGVSQSTVSDFLNGHRGAGNALIRGIARIDQELASFAHGIYAKPVPASGASDEIQRISDELADEGVDVESAVRATRAAFDLLPPGAPTAQISATARVLLTFARGLREEFVGTSTPEPRLSSRSRR